VKADERMMLPIIVIFVIAVVFVIVTVVVVVVVVVVVIVIVIVAIVETLKHHLINYPYLSDYGQTIFCLSFPSRDRVTVPGRCE
jgi:hypothetical protein